MTGRVFYGHVLGGGNFSHRFGRTKTEINIREVMAMEFACTIPIFFFSFFICEYQ